MLSLQSSWDGHNINLTKGHLQPGLGNFCSNMALGRQDGLDDGGCGESRRGLWFVPVVDLRTGC